MPNLTIPNSHDSVQILGALRNFLNSNCILVDDTQKINQAFNEINISETDFITGPSNHDIYMLEKARLKRERKQRDKLAKYISDTTQI